MIASILQGKIEARFFINGRVDIVAFNLYDGISLCQTVIGKMDKKITVVLLLVAMAVHVPAIRLILNQIGFAGLWIEFFIMLLGVVFLVLTGINLQGPQASTNQPSISARFLLGILLAALIVSLWGVLNDDAVWVWRGTGFCFSATMALLMGFSSRRMLHMGLLLGMVPLALWKMAPEMHSIGQWLASSFAGSILDLGKVFYFAKGNVIGLVSTDFLENNACSGLRFTFPCVLLVMTYGFFSRYPIFRCLYLLVVCLFWSIVADGSRIAYHAFIQDGQEARIHWDLGALPLVIMLSVLFLTWSGDQFYSAFSGQANDKDQESSKETQGHELPSDLSNRESRFSSFAVWSVLLGIVGLGGWSIYKNQWVHGLEVGQAGATAAVESLRLDPSIAGWTIGPATESAENFSAHFRQTPSWTHREWELTQAESQDGTMKLRVDGIWLRLPKHDWLWRWYGWKTDRVVPDENGSASFEMKRSIVEEGYVVTKGIRVLGDSSLAGPLVQVSLVLESVRPISQKQRKEQQDLHARMVQAIEQQLRFGAAIDGKNP